MDKTSEPGLEAETGARRELLARIMRRQAALSLRVAGIFVAILVLLPLINAFAAKQAGQTIGGFTLTWMILGILFYPITWALSKYFVGASEKVEAEIAQSEGSARE